MSVCPTERASGVAFRVICAGGAPPRDVYFIVPTATKRVRDSHLSPGVVPLHRDGGEN